MILSRLAVPKYQNLLSNPVSNNEGKRKTTGSGIQAPAAYHFQVTVFLHC